MPHLFTFLASLFLHHRGSADMKRHSGALSRKEILKENNRVLHWSPLIAVIIQSDAGRRGNQDVPVSEGAISCFEFKCTSLIFLFYLETKNKAAAVSFFYSSFHYVRKKSVVFFMTRVLVSSCYREARVSRYPISDSNMKRRADGQFSFVLWRKKKPPNK